MKRRKILTGTEARDKMMKGADYLADAVKSTLGPHGQNFFLDKKNTITNDGVSIAREIQLPDEIENRGAAALREAATKTVDQAGDGTTTSIVLAQAIYKSGSRLLSKTNVIGKQTPSEVIRKIEQERKEVTDKLMAMATPVDTKEKLIEAAIVAVEDPDLGKLIGETQWELGKDGVLIAEDSNDKTSSVERVKGIRIDNGFGSSGIVNNPEKWTLELEDVHILLTSWTIKDISHWDSLMKLFEPAFKSGVRQLVVIARAWTDETLNYCLQNLQRGSLKIYPLNAPYMDMNERFKDLSAVTGATFYDSESSTLEDMYVSGLGKAQRVIGKRMESLITGKDDELTLARVTARVAEIQKQIDGSESDFEKKHLRERIAQLTNGFAIVKVGSYSDMDKQRILDKVDDAVNATKAAFQEGTVPGGGLAFKQIADQLPDDYILKRPLMAPYEQIMSSAPSDFVIEDWVRNPVKVERIALANACSAASAFATAGGVITEEFPKHLDELLGKSG